MKQQIHTHTSTDRRNALHLLQSRFGGASRCCDGTVVLGTVGWVDVELLVHEWVCVLILRRWLPLPWLGIGIGNANLVEAGVHRSDGVTGQCGGSCQCSGRGKEAHVEIL